MALLQRLNKGTLLAFLFLSCSCSHSAKCPRWQKTCVNSTCPPFCSTKKTFTTDKLCRNIQLEVTNIHGESAIYLNVFSLPIKEDPDHPNQCVVFMTINEKENQVIADRLQGGGRLKLPDSIREQMINALSAGHAITISAGNYSGTITSAGW